jgi:hypothetical protein
MKRYASLLLLALSMLMLAPVTQAVPITFAAILTGANEVPATPSLGIGNALVTIDSATNIMHVVVTFSGLLSPTTASHIHCCGPAGTNQMVATTTPTFPGFPLGVTSGAYDRFFNLLDAGTWNPAFITAHGGTIAQAEADFIAGMLAGNTYLNIHTMQFGGGEIRGQLRIPEPATLALLAFGLLLLGFVRRRAPT